MRAIKLDEFRFHSCRCAWFLGESDYRITRFDNLCVAPSTIMSLRNTSNRLWGSWEEAEKFVIRLLIGTPEIWMTKAFSTRNQKAPSRCAREWKLFPFGWRFAVTTANELVTKELWMKLYFWQVVNGNLFLCKVSSESCDWGALGLNRDQRLDCLQKHKVEAFFAVDKMFLKSWWKSQARGVSNSMKVVEGFLEIQWINAPSMESIC